MPLRMTFAQYRQSITRTGPPPARKGRAKTGRKPKRWRLLSQGVELATCEALTKSEARAVFKEDFDPGDDAPCKRLPVGCVVEEVKE